MPAPAVVAAALSAAAARESGTTVTNRERDALPLPDEMREFEALLSQVAWFNRLRLLVAASVVWLTALATHALGLVDDPWPLYLLGAGTAFVDGLYILAFSRLQSSGVHGVRRHVYLQIAVDLLILTALLHLSGGITNPLALFYLFHAFIAALVYESYFGTSDY